MSERNQQFDMQRPFISDTAPIQLPKAKLFMAVSGRPAVVEKKSRERGREREREEKR